MPRSRRLAAVWSTVVSAAKLPAAADVIKKRTEIIKEAPKDPPQSPETESRPSVRSGFDDQLRGKPPPRYTEPSKTICGKRRSWVLSCRSRAYFPGQGTYESCEYVAMFLQAFLIRRSYHVKHSCQDRQCYFTRYELGLLHCSCNEWKRTREGNVRCLIQGSTAQRWTATAAVFCSTPYRLSETILQGSKRLYRLI